MSRQLDLRLLWLGLPGFWALHFAIVTLWNLMDLFGSLHVLPAGWRWMSGNLGFIAASTAKFGVPAWFSQASSRA